MLEIFRNNIVMGVQFAFPIIAIEMVTEAAVGILMRMIPQINVFAVNFHQPFVFVYRLPRLIPPICV